MSESDDIIAEFLVESREGLDQLDRDLVDLEQHPSDQEMLKRIFRCIHTVKGTSGFLGFGKLESVTHVGESLLSDLRDGKKTLTPVITSALLELVDAVRAILERIEASGQDGDEVYADLIERLTKLQEADGPVAVEKKPVSPRKKRAPKVAERASEDAVAPSGAPAAALAATRAAANAPTPDASHAPRPAEAPAAPASRPVADEVRSTQTADSNIRVDVSLLDKLMNLVGELVLARNQILQFTASQNDTAFVATSQRLNLITTELQEGVMKTRMQPIGNVWSKFPRVVRDLAIACDKQARLDMEGQETELDKTIIEAIKDPLTHIVRNSVDHGLERPAERVAKGKPAEGRLLLRAYHEGGQVNIEISDDGAGIDPERIRQKALQRGVITLDQASRLSDREALSLVFLPGFSTAEKITNVSGRGVGMDVVKTNIERIGGTVDIYSVLGQGTTLKIKIPLTLAIIPALIITSAGDRYAIPQVSLLELVRLEADEVRQAVEMVHGAPVYRLRGQLLPLVHLNHALGLQRGFWSDSGTDFEPGTDFESGTDSAINIVVLQADEQMFGLVVETINDTEEIVVKPLGKQLKGLTAYAGATIMGDGRVALILDVLGLAQRANVLAKARDRARGEVAAVQNDSAGNRQMLLLFRLGADRRMAIPLSQISRLEEFPLSAVERTGELEVAQYRGGLLPLIRLSDVMDPDAPRAEFKDPLQVVVYSDGNRHAGLVVETITDIIEEVVTLHRREKGGMILGTAVIQQRVTDLIDVGEVIRRTGTELFNDSPVAELAGMGV
jgi:two-component system chemotaxis sensor kinase CheA